LRISTVVDRSLAPPSDSTSPKHFAPGGALAVAWCAVVYFALRVGKHRIDLFPGMTLADAGCVFAALGGGVWLFRVAKREGPGVTRLRDSLGLIVAASVFALLGLALAGYGAFSLFDPFALAGNGMHKWGSGLLGVTVGAWLGWLASIFVRKLLFVRKQRR
jgi:hypothetical protein